MQREAIRIYQESGKTGKYGFCVRYNSSTGKPYISKQMTQDCEQYSRNSNDVITHGNFYMIIVDENTITTNIEVDQRETERFKIKIRRSSYKASQNEYYGFNEPEVYR